MRFREERVAPASGDQFAADDRDRVSAMDLDDEVGSLA